MIVANFRQTRQTFGPSQLAWSGVGGHAALSLCLSNEPGELGHDDSTINVVSSPTYFRKIACKPQRRQGRVQSIMFGGEGLTPGMASAGA